MAPIKDFISKFSDFKNNKKLILSSAAIALLLLASVIGIACTKSNQNKNQKITTLSPTSHAVLKSVCSSTLYPELCFSAVASTGKKLTSQKDVIEASLNLTTKAVKHNYFLVKKLITKRKGLTAREVTALHDCLETIDETLDELYMAVEDIHQYPRQKSLRKHADDLKTLISSAITNQQTCLDGFSYDNADRKVRKALMKGQVRKYLLFLKFKLDIKVTIINYKCL